MNILEYFQSDPILKKTPGISPASRLLDENVSSFLISVAYDLMNEMRGHGEGNIFYEGSYKVKHRVHVKKNT